MATGARIIERFSPLTGHLPSTLDRLLRALRAARLAPIGGRGGGRSSAHFEAHPIVHVMLALAEPMPSDGPEAVEVLRAMPHRGTENPPADARPALPTLEDMLADWISDLATFFGKGRRADDPAFDPHRSWKMQLCLNPRHAIITVENDGNVTTHVYASDPGPLLAVQRVTILSGDLLMAAGELLADTIEQNNAIARPPTPQIIVMPPPAPAPGK